ncbi:hypothetical protein [Paraburkholderia kururiensis]|uniref:hypothetical protein n=1 Tax=Paraburkholderia kururiensis TaxID=984307 RepID=UPI00034A022B|nr:hypothetical protein [Paraburkholderia kururiensis]
MGKPSASGNELAPQVVAGTLASVAAGTSSAFLGRFNFAVWGTFVATVILQKSYDGGTTWIAARDENGNIISLTAAGSLVVSEPEPGVLYEPSCTAYTSGTVNYRMSGGVRLT